MEDSEDLTMANRGSYIGNLPRDIQSGIRRAIRRRFTAMGYRPNEVDELTQTQMQYRLGDVEDLIDVPRWIEKANEGKPRRRSKRTH